MRHASNLHATDSKDFEFAATSGRYMNCWYAGDAHELAPRIHRWPCHSCNGRVFLVAIGASRGVIAHTPAGIGAAELRRAIVHLEQAIALAPDAQKRALEGFIGIYDDVRQRKGSFMAFLCMPDLPFDPAYKCNVFRSPAAPVHFTFGGTNLPDAQDLKEQ